MALVRVETNVSVGEDRAKSIRTKMARAVATITAEPERDVRVEVAGDRRMRMAATGDNLVHVEIRNVEISKDHAPELTRTICPVLEEALAVRGDQIYIAVVSTRNSMWRVNGVVNS
ncbi:MAG: hypothetical protein LUE17_10830 [Planctomycetaceae bacterium]|nr:hypothetical protein [Planctomycetaceae bacterium]